MSTRTEIKENFQTGDTPTASQFGDWIDSDFNLTLISSFSLES